MCYMCVCVYFTFKIKKKFKGHICVELGARKIHVGLWEGEAHGYHFPCPWHFPPDWCRGLCFLSMAVSDKLGL